MTGKDTRSLVPLLPRCAAPALVLALAACVGPGSSPTLPPRDAGTPLAAATANGKALIAITVPRSAPADVLVTSRNPAYVSAATKGMTVAFRRGGKVAAQQVIALTPGSPGCSKVPAGTRCKVSISLKACSGRSNCYLAAVVTYDAVTCKGKPATCSIPAKARQLSTEQKYPVGIFADRTTTLTLALSGIPVATKIVPADPVTRLNGAAFDLVGPGPHALTVAFIDADGETIVGTGTPGIAFSKVSGGLFPVTVATPSPGANEIYVTPPAAFDGTSTASFSVTPTFAGQATNGCRAPNANCAPVGVTVDMVRMAAIAGTGLQLYALGDATPLATLDGGYAGVAVDAAGNLYTGYSPRGSGGSNGCNSGAALGVYEAPLVGDAAPTFLSCGAAAIAQGPAPSAYVLTINPQFEGTQFCSNAVCTRSVTGLGNLYNAVAADAAGDVAANVFSGPNSRCSVYVGTLSVTLPGSFPCAQSLVFDASGNLFAIVPSNAEVVELSKSSNWQTQTVIATSPSIPYQLAVDGEGNVVIAGQNPATLAATLQESLATTLNANQGGSIVPDRTVVLATPGPGQGPASEAVTAVGEVAYVQYSFLRGSSGSFAAFALPGLTQAGAATTNATLGATSLQVLP